MDRICKMKRWSRLFSTLLLVLSLLAKKCSGGGAEVEACSFSTSKGYNQVLKLEMEHYYETKQENCYWEYMGVMDWGWVCDNVKYGKQDRNKICLDRDLYLLTTTDCDGIKDENNFIFTCDNWNICSNPRCCFRIYYSATYDTQLTLRIPGFSFLSKSTTSFSSNTQAEFAGNSNWQGTTCDTLNGPIISSITGIHIYIYIYRSKLFCD